MKYYDLTNDLWAICFAGVLLGYEKRKQQAPTRYRAMVEANRQLVGVALPPKPGVCYPKILEFERLRLVTRIKKQEKDLLYPAPTLGRWFLDTVPAYAIRSAELMLKDWQSCLKVIIYSLDADLLATVISGLEVCAHTLAAPVGFGCPKISANDANKQLQDFERQKFGEYMRAILTAYRQIAKNMAK